MKKAALVLATGFGLGFSPIASGTFGSLPGVLIVWALWFWAVPVSIQAVVAAALVLLAIPVCEVGERVLGRKDDGRIVADEYMTFPICMIGIPFTWWTVPMAFVICRVMDIIKPPPARQLQALHGGVGIVIDDVFASLYALALNHLLFRLIEPWMP